MLFYPKLHIQLTGDVFVWDKLFFWSSNKTFVGNIAALCNYMRPQFQNINVCVFHHCHSPHQKLSGEWVQAFGATKKVRLVEVCTFSIINFYNCIRLVCMSRFFRLWWVVNLVHQYRIFTWRHGDHIGVPNNETAAMLVTQTNPVGVELFSYANAFFCSNKFAYILDT